ncbi:diguanylate cyclase domain-containing protein [Pseudomonas plecoglossicida]|uniref:diguanylate cyclase domain-containing protein n=1 Tax=Pseudomonas plecoglossicida TaxID=70775 RepID=UPI003D244496
MKLRKKLLCLFTPPMLLVLALMWVWGHSMLLSRLDQEDKHLLMVEADRLRAMLEVLIERDVDRLTNLSEVIERSGSLPLSAPTGFDFLIQFHADASFAVLQPLSQRKVTAVSAFYPVTHDILQVGIVERLVSLRPALNTKPHGQLIAVRDIPMILVGTGTPNGYLFGGTLLDTERVSQLQKELGGALIWAPPGDSDLVESTNAARSQMSVSRPQTVDADHNSMALVFHDSLGKPQLGLRLIRERHLYQAGLRELNFFLVFLTASLVLAWLAIHLGLEWFLLRRIRKMHAELAAIGPDDPGSRLRDRGHDELADLGHEANRTLDRMEQSEARDAAILAGIQEGYFELDPTGHLQSVNPAFCTQTGYPAERLSGMAFTDLMENREDLQAVLNPVKREERPSLSTRLRHADGSVGHYQARITEIRGGQKQLNGYRGILHDVSAHVEYQDLLFAMAHNDALTGLGNRKAFHCYLEELLSEQPQPLTLFFIDLDRFKQVNDTFGHEVGDELLTCLARRLENSVRTPDRAFRLGGDEFTLVVLGDNTEAAGRLAQRLLSVLSKPVSVGDVIIDYVTPSIGIALSPRHSTDASELIKAADAAMYEAKQQRNQVCLAD